MDPLEMISLSFGLWVEFTRRQEPALLVTLQHLSLLGSARQSTGGKEENTPEPLTPGGYQEGLWVSNR